jgi:S1-C subfamily serine protease
MIQPGGEEIARDPASHLAVVRVPDGAAPAPPIWSPGRFDYPRFLMAADVSGDGISFRPVYVGSLSPLTSPIWAGTIWALPEATEIAPGTFVFTVEGEVAGLVVERDGRHAIVPAGTVVAAADRLAREGPRRPGHLGVQVQALTPALSAATGASLGAIVTWVDPLGPAAKHIEVTDVIEAVDGEAVTTFEHWEARRSRLVEGEGIVLKVRRGGEVRDVPLTAAVVPTPPANRSLGLTLRSIRQVGVEIVRVEPGSTAFRAGLEAGDVITRFGDVDAPSAGQVSRVFAATPDDRPVLAAVTRRSAHLVFALEKLR